MGGLGTLQASLGMSSLYGSNIDVLMWDSSMTEGDAPSKDVFTRQGILLSDRPPVLWGEPDDGRYEIGFVSTGMWGAGMNEMPLTKDAAQVKTIPFASRYLNCDKDAGDLCKNNRFRAICMLKDKLNVTVTTNQRSEPSGQASWHPGNRAYV
jgi:hypothetical protein